MNGYRRTGRHRDLRDISVVLLARACRQTLRERGDGVTVAAVVIGLSGVVSALIAVKATELPMTLLPADVAVTVTVGPASEPVEQTPLPASYATGHLAPVTPTVARVSGISGAGH